MKEVGTQIGFSPEYTNWLSPEPSKSGFLSNPRIGFAKPRIDLDLNPRNRLMPKTSKSESPNPQSRILIKP